jgi:FlaA1/EpsC-like NDP-sugar epimerase
MDATECRNQGPRWSEFLGRNSPSSLKELGEKYRAGLAGRRVLITGAGGSIGSALAQAVAYSSPVELILLDSAEGPLYEVSQNLKNTPGANHLAVLASVCDATALDDIFARYQPEVVFHAGAFKHVTLMEMNPFSVAANNVLGTRILADAAAVAGSRQLVMLSTDKAVAPCSLMGASKRLAELLVLAPHPGTLRTSAVRLGNVLGSSGSVVPLFLRQISQGGPVTVSHPDVRRYFLTMTEAVEALLYAASPHCPEGLLAPQPGSPMPVLDLAKFLIAQQSTQNIPIVFTSLRPGDKMEESLISAEERFRDGAEGILRAIDSPMPTPENLATAVNLLQQAVERRDLSLLLESVLRVVPEYQPSQLLLEQLSHPTSVVVA